jgi:hypothetical protein
MSASVIRAQAVDEAARRRVEVEEPNRLRAGDAKAVDGTARRGDEGSWACDARLVADPELDVAFEDVERVDVVGVGVRVDALELGLEGHVDGSQLRQVAEDPMRARLVHERLGLIRPGEDSLGKRPAAVGRRVVLVEIDVLAADVVAEAARGRVEVEEESDRIACIAEGVDDVGRRGGEAARGRADGFELGAERDLDLAFEHVEGVGVVVVDVRVRSLLAGLVAEPRHDHVGELGEDPQRPLGAVGDRLALAGR